MKKTLLATFLFGLFSAMGEIPPNVKKTLEAFDILSQLPREKVYLHTDKEIYRVGEEIRFRAYLLDASTNIPAIRSRYVYVELMDQRDSVLRRIKIQDFDSVFHGTLTLPDTLFRGNYVLRAYTYWMQNEGTDYHYRKHIRVLNPMDSRMDTHVSYTYDEKGILWANIQLKNHHGEPWSESPLLLEIDKRGKGGPTSSVKTDKEGFLRFPLDTTDYSIHLHFKNDIPFRMDRRIYIPTSLTDFDVQFFPEGGHLLSDNLQRVAFKAIGLDGLSVDVEGMVYADSTALVSFRSDHKGMGSFKLPVYAGKRYSARVRLASGLEKRFLLPDVEREGVSLSLTLKDSLLNYRVHRGERKSLPDGLHLVVHSRGILLTVMPVERLTGRLKLSSLPAGIAHAILVDKKQRVHSDRLFFIPPRDTLELNLYTNKQEYDTREKVEVVLTSNFTTDSLLGAFSIAVVDSMDSKALIPEDHVVSNLLLTSDLKGHVENPAYYLSDTAKQEHVDLLMLTQGWKRFDVPALLQGEKTATPFYLERGQAISGIIENYNAKHGLKVKDPQKEAEERFIKDYKLTHPGKNWEEALERYRMRNGYIAPNPTQKKKQQAQGSLMLVSNKGHFQVCLPDSTGRFHADVAFTDSTTFKIGFANLKIRQRAYLKINPDREYFLPASNVFFSREEIQKEEEEFYNNYDLSYFIENGERVYLLDEVTVKKTRQKKYYSTFEHWAEDFRRFDSTDIANMEGETVLDVIKKLPDVMVIGNQVIPASQPPTDKAICVFINGFPEEPVWLAWHPKKYLLSVNYIEGSVATTLLHPYTTDSSFIKQYLIKGINTKEDNKIIWVTTSDDTLMKPLVRHSIEFTPLGVSIPSKFYQPRYDVDSIRNNHKQRDTRTTLYWNPRLAFYAREKKKITFYTNDKRGYYYMVIEGITREGIPIRRVQRIKLK